MLWLNFPPHVNVPFFMEKSGTRLKSFSELKQEDAGESVLVHVVYSTEQPPRAVIHDTSDTVFLPLNVSGLSVSVPYLLPRGLVDAMLDALPPSRKSNKPK